MSSVNLVSSNSFIQRANPQVKIALNCLCQKIRNIFTEKAFDKIVQPLEFTKDLLKLEKQETEKETIRTLTLDKYGSIFDEKTGKLFVSLLHKLPESPLEMGLEYVRTAPGYDSVKGFQVPNDWEKKGTVTLRQIYKEQLFAWICKNSGQSFDCILLMLKLLQSFDDFSIQVDDQVWDKLLLLTKQEQLKEFRSKYQFLLEHKFLQFFPIELEKIISTHNICKTMQNQSQLFDKALMRVIRLKRELANQAFMWVNRLEKDRQENALIKENAKEIFSDKILAYRLKRDLFEMQPLMKSLINELEQNKRPKGASEGNRICLKNLEDERKRINDILHFCKEKREQVTQPTLRNSQQEKVECHNYQLLKEQSERLVKLQQQQLNHRLKTNKLHAHDREMDRITQGFASLNREFGFTLQKKTNTLIEIQETERFFIEKLQENEDDISSIKAGIHEGCWPVYKEDFLLIDLLMDHINHAMLKEQIKSKEKREGVSSEQFDEMLEKEFTSLEKKPSSGKKLKVKKRSHHSKDQLHVSKDEKECLNTAASLTPKLLLNKAQPAFNEDLVQIYLDSKEEDKQLHGCLSQKIKVFLEKQIKPLLYQEQGKEVYDHILLGTAALEHMAQAVYEGRRDHIVLGFRSLLIHCYFSVEQMLSQKILQNTGLITNSHDLRDLASKLEENFTFSREEEDFFREKVHLWFRYPGDYRLQYNEEREKRLQQGKKAIAFPKALSLLEDLSKPEISEENVQKAVVFSFAKYCQALGLIAKLSKAPASNIVEDINHLKEQLLDSKKSKKRDFVKSTSLLQEVEKAKTALNMQNFDQIQDLEKEELFAIFNTIKNYLQYMEISLQTPQKSSTHSLQKFLHIETLLNMDKLFKHLFRAISVLHLEEDNRTHNLDKFYSMVEGFYKGFLSTEDKKLLNYINLNITHHYFQKKSASDLKKNYDRFLRSAILLSSVPQGFTLVTSDGEISEKTLQEEEKTIANAVLSSLKIFNRILPRVISNVGKIHSNREDSFKELKIG